MKIFGFLLIFISNFSFASPPDPQMPSNSTTLNHTGITGYAGATAPGPQPASVTARPPDSVLSQCEQYRATANGSSGSCTINGNTLTWGEGSGDESRGKPGSTNTLCDSALKTTQQSCKGAAFMTNNAQMIQLGGAVIQAKKAGNTKQACESAKKLNLLGAGANAYTAQSCARAVRTCKSQCIKGDPQTGKIDAEQCDEFDDYAKTSTMQAVQYGFAYAASSACADEVADKCIGPEASNNEECQQFCTKPGRQDHPKCKIALNSCGDANFAAQNAQYCTCVTNPFNPNCASVASLPVPTKPPELNLDDAGLGGSDYDFAGGVGEPRTTSVNSGDGSGGGFGGGGDGSAAFGAEGAGGAGDEALNKDILTGSGSGGGAAGIFGGGGFAEGGAGGGKGSGGNDLEDKGFDLKAFLPGGKNDPSRNPASAGYGDPSITKANGLTNFQKVTAKMNQKRPEMAP